MWKLLILASMIFAKTGWADTSFFIAPTGTYLTNTLNEQATLMGIELAVRVNFLEIPIIGRGTKIGNDLMLTGAGGIRFVFFNAITISALGGYSKIGKDYKSPFYGTDISLLIPVGDETELVPYIEYDLDTVSQKRSFLMGIKLSMQLYSSKSSSSDNK